MMRALRLASTIRSVVRRVGEITILALFASLVAACLAQVVARYVFDAPLTWSEELARYLFIWLSFLGAWLAWVRRVHLGIDFLQTAMPPRVAMTLRIVCEIAVAAFALVAMYHGQRLLQISLNQPSAVLRLPMACVYLSFYVGMTMIVFEILVGWLTGFAARGEVRTI